MARYTEALQRYTSATFSSLHNRNYRLYYIGQVISTSGTFMQSIDDKTVDHVEIQSNQILYTVKDDHKKYKTGIMNDPTLAQRLEDSDQRRKILGQYVIRRLGEPDDVAHLALFLASDASGWITGQTYPVNGGYSFTT